VLYQCLKIFLNAISSGVRAIATFLYSATKNSLKGFWWSLKSLFDFVVNKVLGTIGSAYFGIYRYALRKSKLLGYFGELLFIFYGLAWLLWPLGLSYFIQKEYGHPEVWVGGIIIAVIFIVRGRQIILEE